MFEENDEGLGGKLDFLSHFSALTDPRQSAKGLYPLSEVLLLTLCAENALHWVLDVNFRDDDCRIR